MDTITPTMNEDAVTVAVAELAKKEGALRARQVLERLLDNTERGYDVESFIELGDGVAFHFFDDPKKLAEIIDPVTIARSGSKLCRYNGHTRRFYSTLEHECILADFVAARGGTPQECLTILHHDDAESLGIGDMVTPLKRVMPDFKALEHRLDEAVSIKFGTIFPFPQWVKEFDSRIVKNERARVMRPSANTWGIDKLEELPGLKFMPIRGRIQWWIAREWLKRHSHWTLEMQGVPMVAPRVHS